MAENTAQNQEEVKTSKFGLQEQHTVEGVEYTFQFPGVKSTIELLDRSRNGFNNVVDSAYYTEIMEHVIVSPRTNWEYWDKHDGLREVMHLADNFLGRQL
ncbi:hypothetical protein [Peribacillus asahii]|uniref:hypothetical protein n=1 Tax=Peribacillus asahii TaxID=228899 RepID=UPI00380ADCCF